jgi:hypothetical protein
MKIHQSPLFVAVAIFSVLLGGCIPSLRPVYTEGDLVFEKALLGAWQPSDGSSRWEFAPGVGKSYRFTFTDKDGVSSEFEAHLARFDDLTYLDLQPTEKGITGNAFYKAYTLRLHTFLRVDQLDDSHLQLSSLDGSWLSKQLAEHPQLLPHEKVGEGLMVTASPEQLQAFLKAHQDTPDAFSKATPLQRVKAK